MSATNLRRHLSNVAVVVPDYDEAIEWFTTKLGFQLLEDEQRAVIGNQGGGRVWPSVVAATVSRLSARGSGRLSWL